ncbi:MAG: sugar transferase [Lachnospiraceae bacterium]|nr:sugar transferase [Lachnospiraceae bacterium]
MNQRRFKLYADFIKRFFDAIISAMIIILFFWLYIIVAVMVRLKLGSPVLFKQDRPGRIDPKTGKEKIFRLYKFRTMTDEKDENGNLLSDEVRLTSFGKWLRQTSLDEIPEMFNIMKGDMSLIGPRPLLVEYLPRYNKEQRRRHEVLPGLTGYAQVSGRNSISWEEKFEDDVWYVDHLSFLLDVKIFFKTIAVVFQREGISSDSCATMEVFAGTKKDKDN